VITNSIIRAAIERAGLPEPEPGRLHLCGVRVGAQGSDRYDDLLLVFGTELHSFPCTVDPGRTFTLRPEHPQGCAHLTWGRWRYRIGTHKGRAALVQAAPVTVRRDRDRDGVAEAGEPLSSGWLGLNIHRGGSSPSVGSWSAGCQVLPERSFVAFWKLIEASGQREFWYYLLPDSVTAALR
jgi:hypothetical protein